MAVRIAINGFGRIGRLVLRAILESKRDDVEVVGINDLGPVEINAHLLKYDSNHGTLQTEIVIDSDSMDVGTGLIKVTAERDPANLPWKDLGVDVALECTGLFTDRESASKHLDAGANKVLISAPAKDVGDRGQAVGGAGRVGDHGVVRLELIVIDAVDHGHVDLLGRGGDQYLIGAGVQVFGRRFPVGEEAGAFQGHIDA